MKKFITYSFSMAIILLVVFISIELLLFLRPNIYSYKYNYVKDHSKSIKVLFLGNSHIEESIIPQNIGKNVFNCAISGRRLDYDIELGKKLIPTMDSLQVLVMPLDYSAFSFGRMEDNPNYDEMESPMDKTFSCMYYKYMNIKLNHPLWIWSEILNSKLKYMVRFIESDTKCRECDSLGFVKMSLNSRLPDWKERMLPNYIDIKKNKDYRKVDLLFLQYEQLAKLTSTQKIRLILLSTPMYVTYQQKMEKNISEEMQSFYFQLKKNYKNVEYYDFTYDKDFNEEDFYDASHLSDLGAQKFSKKIKTILSNKSQRKDDV